jgi:hypothetical protein
MSPQGIGISTTYKTRVALKNLVRSVKESLLDSRVSCLHRLRNRFGRDRVRLALICPVASKRIFASVEESPGT